MIGQSEIWWADLGEPMGSTPGYRRPVLVVQCDAINISRIGTVVCIPLTNNLNWGDAPGNVLLSARARPDSRRIPWQTFRSSSRSTSSSSLSESARSRVASLTSFWLASISSWGVDKACSRGRLFLASVHGHASGSLSSRRLQGNLRGHRGATLENQFYFFNCLRIRSDPTRARGCHPASVYCCRAGVPRRGGRAAGRRRGRFAC